MLPETASRGFTLVEVLVAMAIVSISFMALYGGMQQIVQATILMQDKSFATWVAQNLIVEQRLRSDPEVPEKIEGKTEMADMEWQYTITFRSTDSTAISQIIVRVAPANDPERILGLATGVLLRQPGSLAGNFGDSGTALISSTPGDIGFPGAGTGTGELTLEGILE